MMTDNPNDGSPCVTQNYLFKLAFCLSLLVGAKAIAETAAPITPTTAPTTLAPITTNVATDRIVQYRLEVIAERSHKTRLFTQGLLIDGDHFYESSGLYGRSMLASYPIAEPANKWAQLSAKFTQKISLEPQYFAEGLALLNDKLYLLTWREETLLIYNRHTFALEKTLRYRGEGWGLTHDNAHFIRSDGSHRLTFHDPDSFKPVRVIEVFENNKPLTRLNELEYIDGKIWANIWYENRLVEIDPHNGAVVGSVDLTPIASQFTLNSEQVLNGIAYDPERRALWITGKQWPKMFLVKLKKLQ